LEHTKKGQQPAKRIQHFRQWIKGIGSHWEFKFSLSYYVSSDINEAKAQLKILDAGCRGRAGNSEIQRQETLKIKAITKARKLENTKKGREVNETPSFRAFVFSCLRDGFSGFYSVCLLEHG
jgi:hypothetical protein